MPNEKTSGSNNSVNDSKIKESKDEARTKLEIELISGIIILIILVLLAVFICHKKKYIYKNGIKLQDDGLKTNLNASKYSEVPS